MASTQHPPNIWAQMSYTPPRGPCSQKTTLVTTCACYRFMIHPLKAASSYDCDGCGHHASFHRMESKEDEEVARRWRDEEVGMGPGRDMIGVRNGCLGIEGLWDGGMKKRRRIADRAGEVVEVEEGEGASRDVTGVRRRITSVEDLVEKALNKKRRIADETDEVMEVEFLGLRAEERAAVGRRKRKGRGA